MNPNEPKLSESAQTPIASIAESACHPAEAGSGAIAVTPAKQQLTESDGAPNSAHDVMPVTSSIGRRDTAVTETAVTCLQCGVTFTAKRPKQARYCGAACRHRAWLARNPDRAAALAASDKARLRAHLEARGIVWQER